MILQEFEFMYNFSEGILRRTNYKFIPHSIDKESAIKELEKSFLNLEQIISEPLNNYAKEKTGCVNSVYSEMGYKYTPPNVPLGQNTLKIRISERNISIELFLAISSNLEKKDYILQIHELLLKLGDLTISDEAKKSLNKLNSAMSVDFNKQAIIPIPNGLR